MHIIVTLPARIEWEDYEDELDLAAGCRTVLSFRVPTLPKVEPGERCYIVWRGAVRGWHRVFGVMYSPHGFTCGATGKFWPPGYYVQRTGLFHPLDTPVPMKSFRGYRYVDRLPLGPDDSIELNWTAVDGYLVDVEVCTRRGSLGL